MRWRRSQFASGSARSPSSRGRYPGAEPSGNPSGCAMRDAEEDRLCMRNHPPPTRDASTQLPLPRRELRGVVERITYQHPETGYTVARLAPERTETAAGTTDERLVTVVGTLPDLQPGEAIVAS